MNVQKRDGGKKKENQNVKRESTLSEGNEEKNIEPTITVWEKVSAKNAHDFHQNGNVEWLIRLVWYLFFAHLYVSRCRSQQTGTEFGVFAFHTFAMTVLVASNCITARTHGWNVKEWIMCAYENQFIIFIRWIIYSIQIQLDLFGWCSIEQSNDLESEKKQQP